MTFFFLQAVANTVLNIHCSDACAAWFGT